MSFNQHRSGGQNFGRRTTSKRNEIIANSRAKRKERESKKRKESAALIIQRWFRCNLSHQQTINECTSTFNEEITSLLSQSQQSTESLNFSNFNRLLHFFKICIFGFEQRSDHWKVPKRFTSKLPVHSVHQKWFITSVRRLFSIFLRITKTAPKSEHFISHILNDEDSKKPQMIRFRCFGLVLTEYLRITLSRYTISSFRFVHQLTE